MEKLVPPSTRLFRRLGLLLALALSGTLPSVARACSVCYGSGKQESQWAYYGITLFLSLLPLVLLAALGYWVYRVSLKGDEK